MTTQHWGILGLFLAALAMQISGLPGWAEAVKPSFIGGILAQASALILAFYAPSVKVPKNVINMKGRQ